MTPEQIRIACIDLAIDARNAPGEDSSLRASEFQDFVETDETKLGCLRLAVKSHGFLARITTDRILEEATGYLKLVKPPAPDPVPEPQKPARLPGRKKGGRSSIPSR